MPDDDELIIDLEMGSDPDGLPKTVPGKQSAEPRARAKEDPGERFDEAELESARRRISEGQNRLQEMQRNMEAERQARIRAESGALEDRTFAWRSHMAKLRADHEQMQGMLAAANAAREQARRELRVAKEAGDTEAEASALERIGVATAQMQDFERGKAGVEVELARNKEPYEEFEAALQARQRASREANKKDEQPRQLSPDEWVDTQAPPSIRGWLKEHREFMPGGAKIRSLNRFVDQWLEDHDDDRGTLDSKAFARAIDEHFFPDGEELEVANEEPPSRGTTNGADRPAKAKSVAAAPVSRGGNYYSSRNQTARQVRLPADLAKFVKESGLDPTQYAMGVLEDIKAGHLPKEWLDPDFDRKIPQRS